MTQTTSSIPLEEITDALREYAKEHRNPQALWFAGWLHEQFKDNPHRPHRDDDVAAWLSRMRGKFERPGLVGGPEWYTVNCLLNRYNECADYGLTLRPEGDEHGDP